MRFLSCISLGLFLVGQTLHADSLSSKIDIAVNKELPNATVSILIKDAKNGQLIFSRNANKLLAPASNMKLFTAAAALYYWKPDHYFETQLLQKKQNYYIHFGGSPSLTVDNLNSLLIQYLKTHNIKKINGSIVLDTSLFKPPYYPSGVSYDDLGWYYAAPDTAIILNENATHYELITAKDLGKPVTIQAKKNSQKITVINDVITVSKEVEKQHCSLNVEIKPNNTLRLYGCVAQTKNPKSLELAITDPELLAKQSLKQTLKQNGIQFNGQIINEKTPKDAELLAQLHSDPLSKLVNHMLKESDNLYADNLTKQLAYALTNEATNKQAMFAVKDILSKNTRVDFNQIELADGVGTRYNLATAEQITILLGTIYRDKKIFPTFFSSLPQSGVSGSLRDRMKKTALEKIVYAKTGSMHDISALSGYLINPNGRPLIFSIIINGVNKPISKAKALEEQILTIINEEINDDVEHTDFA
ncbi:D-alanyl-D-alanine carboxypeptidase/D-alanyl-D-alanine-endopeptidase [Legionella sp. km772]|uniref:D-alanyl-D-alanine carboxypeptidase/D-alanyl-D-alanine endopeptidase n=1 Tax=Legionella sp. km772 TaxID=2498111 RepID=UPI000F8DE0BD|nr:D-alanyl-D-alanine carboxypeptidase/D-alanyl-D-alanine-endopeptidase [Legionella sp. km772]RUR12373.1 D-alanyl-D-alanine carboxypeptidase/D-alanyl-D-alanine-endopeptidase [Legionella sp. km772]